MQPSELTPLFKVTKPACSILLPNAIHVVKHLQLHCCWFLIVEVGALFIGFNDAFSLSFFCFASIHPPVFQEIFRGRSDCRTILHCYTSATNPDDMYSLSSRHKTH